MSSSPSSSSPPKISTAAAATASADPPPLFSAQRLYETLNTLFDIDPEIREIGLLLTPEPSSPIVQYYTTLTTTTAKREDNNNNNTNSTSGGGRGSQEDLKAEQCTTPFVLQGHRLGIAFWCLAEMYMHAMKTLQQHITATSSEDNNDVKCESILQATRALLLINADCNLAWNHRKRRLITIANTRNRRRRNREADVDVDTNDDDDDDEEEGGCELHSTLVSLYEQELRFINLVATKHPKSVEMWSHRRWVLTRLFYHIRQNRQLSDMELTERLLSLVERETDTCDTMATIYPRNYYAWTYRMIVVERLFSSCVTNEDLIAHDGTASAIAIVLAEFLERQIARLDAFVRRNVSDHSAMHHTQRLLIQWKGLVLPHGDITSGNINARLVNRFLWCVLREVHFCQFLVVHFPGHEALWCHRRFLINFLMQCLFEMDVDRVAQRISDLRELFFVEQQVENFETDEQNDSTFSATSVTFHDFMRQVSFVMEAELHCGDTDGLYAHRTPAVHNEILFAESCATDREMAHYSDQRRLAIAYEIWICYRSVQIIDSMKSIEKQRDDGTGGSGGDHDRAAAFDLLSQVLRSENRDSLVQRAKECCKIASRENLAHGSMWKQVLLEVLQPLEQLHGETNDVEG